MAASILLGLRGPKFTVSATEATTHNTGHDGEIPHSTPSDFRGLLVAPIQETDSPRPQLLSTQLVDYYPGRARPKTVRERAQAPWGSPPLQTGCLTSAMCVALTNSTRHS
jgi:hypothetical protein